MATTTTSTREKIIRLPSHERRSRFCRKEMRKQGLSISDLAQMTGHCWATVSLFLGYDMGAKKATKNPRTDTTKNVFLALGYSLVFTPRRESKGTVEI